VGDAVVLEGGTANEVTELTDIWPIYFRLIVLSAGSVVFLVFFSIWHEMLRPASFLELS
jgi:hypothetical protein